MANCIIILAEKRLYNTSARGIHTTNLWCILRISEGCCKRCNKTKEGNQTRGFNDFNKALLPTRVSPSWISASENSCSLACKQKGKSKEGEKNRSGGGGGGALVTELLENYAPGYVQLTVCAFLGSEVWYLLGTVQSVKSLCGLEKGHSKPLVISSSRMVVVAWKLESYSHCYFPEKRTKVYL